MDLFYILGLFIPFSKFNREFKQCFCFKVSDTELHFHCFNPAQIIVSIKPNVTHQRII